MSKTGIFLILGLVVAVVAYQVLARVPSDALNVALGVACGIGASIPVSFGLLIALMRRRPQNDAQPEWQDVGSAPARYPAHAMAQRVPQPEPQQPQIIVIAPPQGQFAPGQFPQGFPMPAQWLNQQYPFMHENPEAVDARDWRIIGED